MGNSGRRYAPEYKARMVELVRAGRSADQLAREFEPSATAMLAAVNRLMERLKLPVNAQKTQCLRCPEKPLEFLGCRIGWNYRPTDGRQYIGTRPSKASVQSIRRRISAQTDPRYEGWPAEEVVGRLNRMMSGWANCFTLGQVSPAYAAVDTYAAQRLRHLELHTAVEALRASRTRPLPQARSLLLLSMATENRTLLSNGH